MSQFKLATVVASKAIGGEVFRAVFEIRPGKKQGAGPVVSGDQAVKQVGVDV